MMYIIIKDLEIWKKIVPESLYKLLKMVFLLQINSDLVRANILLIKFITKKLLNYNIFDLFSEKYIYIFIHLIKLYTNIKIVNKCYKKIIN